MPSPWVSLWACGSVGIAQSSQHLESPPLRTMGVDSALIHQTTCLVKRTSDAGQEILFVCGSLNT